MKYLVRMRVEANYTRVVEAESEEDAYDIAWDEADFGEAYNAEGYKISCEPKNE